MVPAMAVMHVIGVALTWFGVQLLQPTRVLGARDMNAVPPELATYLERGYRPRRAVNARVRAWAGVASLAAAPKGRDEARSTINRVIRYGEFLIARGFDLDSDPAEIFADAVIANFVESQISPRARPTVASMLRRVRRALTGERKLQTVLPRVDVEGASVPVSDEDVAEFLRWVAGLDESLAGAWDGPILVSLLRGAGATVADLDTVKVDDLRPLEDGSVDIVLGEAKRRVAVRAPYSAALLRAKEVVCSGSPFAKDSSEERSGRTALKSLENRFCRTFSRENRRTHVSWPHFINVNAYRAAWLLERLEQGVRLDRLLREAGLTSAAGLDRYLQYLTDSVSPKARSDEACGD